MMIKKYILLFSLLTGMVYSQQNDTLKYPLSLENYLSIIIKYHPVSKQADLVTKMAKANLLNARGNFDPKILADLNTKSYDNKNYWFLLDSKLEIPTWYGIEIQAGYQYWQGDYFDSHERTPDIGLPYAGISVSLGRGLFMDDRMAAVKQAKIFNEMADFEKQRLLNDLFFESIQAFLQWYFAYNEVQIYSQAVDLSQKRFNQTKGLFFLGEKPAIDTLEMYSIYQARLISLSNVKNDFRNAQATLSNFLWNENGDPVAITDSIYPVLNDSLYKNLCFNQDSLDKMMMNVSDYNPYTNQIRLNLQQLRIDKTLKTNKLLPQIDVTYNFLYNQTTPQYFTTNYKLGGVLQFPLFFRKEIGDLKLVKYKIQDTELKLANKQNEINNKIRGYYYDYTYGREQLAGYVAVTDNYKTLLDAEQKKFNIGESTVFMVNARETKYLETLIKRRETEAKVVKSLYAIYWGAGNLF